MPSAVLASPVRGLLKPLDIHPSTYYVFPAREERSLTQALQQLCSFGPAFTFPESSPSKVNTPHTGCWSSPLTAQCGVPHPSHSRSWRGWVLTACLREQLAAHVCSLPQSTYMDHTWHPQCLACAGHMKEGGERRNMGGGGNPIPKESLHLPFPFFIPFFLWYWELNSGRFLT